MAKVQVRASRLASRRRAPQAFLMQVPESKSLPYPAKKRLSQWGKARPFFDWSGWLARALSSVSGRVSGEERRRRGKKKRDNGGEKETFGVFYSILRLVRASQSCTRPDSLQYITAIRHSSPPMADAPLSLPSENAIESKTL